MAFSGRASLRACFFLSGATSLILEIAWSKELSYVLGNTLFAVSTVIAAFMAGLGVGCFWLARYADRTSRPVRAYAAIQVVVALLGAASIPLLRATGPLFQTLHQSLSLNQEMFLLIRFLVVFLLLFPPAVLMGMTLPIMVGALARRNREDSREGGFLYGINTLGAVAGTLAASFWLIPALGLLGTCILAGAIDLAIAAVALGIDREVGVVPPAAQTSGGRGLTKEQRILAILFGLSGAVAIAYEVAWFRVLGLVFGPSVYAFAAMLGMYLLGVGLGSFVAAPWVQRMRWPGLAAFAGGEALLGAIGLVVFHGMAILPAAYSRTFESLLPVAGMAALPVAQLVTAALLVLAPCLIMGALFPVTVRAFREVGRDFSPEGNVGQLYVWNTVGGIGGSLLAGFVLIPGFGVGGTLVAAGLLSLALAIGATALALSTRRHAPQLSTSPEKPLWKAPEVVAIIPGLAAALILLVLAPTWNISRFNQGRYQQLYQGGAIAEEEEGGQLVFHREGINASVAVYRMLGSAALHVGGKPDASTSAGDVLTQSLSGHLPMLFSSDLRNVAVIGYGSGMTAGAVLTHPQVERVDLIEIEQGVLDASPFFANINRNPLDDPRSRLVVEDGRIHMMYSRDRYGVIISEPSNPWMAGIGNLFSVEFYQAVRERLEPGGVFAQWIQNYDLSESALATVLSTLHSSFAHLVVFQPAPGDYIVLASDQPLRAPWSRVLERWTPDLVRASFARANVQNPLQLGFFLVGPEEATLALAAEATVQNTDDNAWLEHRAPFEMIRRRVEALAQQPGSMSLIARGAGGRVDAFGDLFPGVPVAEMIHAAVSYPHSWEPGLMQGGVFGDPWADVRSAQIPPLVDRLRDPSAPRIGSGGDGAAWADSVIAWEAQGSRYRAAREHAAAALMDGKDPNAALAQALRLAPDLPMARLRWAVGEAARGETDVARRSLEEILQHPESNASYFAQLGLAQLALQAGNHAKALELVDSAAAYNPYFANAFVLGAELRLAMDAPAEAAGVVEQGLRFNPNHARLVELRDSLQGAR